VTGKFLQRELGVGAVQPTKIVLLDNRSLFTTGVLKLLLAMNGISVSVVPSDSEDWADTVRSLCPKVIVLDSSDAFLGENTITHILDEYPGTRVVALSLDRGSISVYQVDRVTNTTLDGLREAIQVPNNNPAS
jgi:DNA-binding NarL/FixJ family response regulator